MNIREVQRDDLQELLNIWEQSVRASHHFLSEQDIQSLRLVVRDQALPNLEIWVLCNDQAMPIGFMGLDGKKLEALFISPSHFRQGGGQLMLQHARQLKGSLHVDVNEQNTDALQFYVSNGFHVTSRSETDTQGQTFPLLHLHETAE